MSNEESLKRKSPEKEVENAEESTNEPETKVQKIDTETAEPNLEINDVCDTKESNLNEIIDGNINKECVEVQNLDTEISEHVEKQKGDTEISEHVEEQKVATEISEHVEEQKVDTETSVHAEEQKVYTEILEQPSESRSSSISIKFHDQNVADKYKSKIVQFLASFIELQVETQDDLSLEIFIDDSINPDDWVMVDVCEQDLSSNVVESTKPVEIQENLHSAATEDDSLETSSAKKKRKKRSKVKKELFIVDATPSPTASKTDLRYTTKFTISTEKEAEQSTEHSSKQSCFNCNQYHSLKDCKFPRDYNRINLARQKLFRQQSKSRYHLEEEQKFSHLAPGKISSELKKALGLYKNEAPHFIYLMRRMGYPPGWLEEAKLVHSDLEMFDIDGNFLKTSSAKKKGLDPAKIVDFPGFNVPFEKGIKDDYRKYGVPPYSEEFSKEAMINFFEKKFAQEEDNLETCDMDIDHEQETSSSQEKPQKEEIGGNERRDSPSLLDLEEQKQQLLEELKDETKEKADKDFLTVKTTHFGTPVLKSNSPYMTLPDPDKFSKDVSPVINFENLPNSTGKYEQMTDVLQKVRSTLKKIQQKLDT